MIALVPSLLSRLRPATRLRLRQKTDNGILDGIFFSMEAMSIDWLCNMDSRYRFIEISVRLQS